MPHPAAATKVPVTDQLALRVNGEPQTAVVEPHTTLLEVLREPLGLTGTKFGCELGECGACTVLLDGEPTLSCLTLAGDAADRDVTTVEGLGGAEPSPLQTAFVEAGAAQCGFCTAGMLVTGTHLLAEDPTPDRSAIEAAIAGNLCRCTGYTKIVDAIELTARGEFG